MCNFSSPVKRRGPPSKNPKPSKVHSPTDSTPSTRALLYDKPNYEEFTYICEFLNRLQFFPPLNKQVIQSPTSLRHQMIRFAVLSLIAKSFGDVTRSFDYFTAARQIAGQLLDDPSYDSGSGFLLMTCVCIMNNDKRASHYASYAWNHAKYLGTEYPNCQLQSQALISSIVLDPTLSSLEKQKILSTYCTEMMQKKSDPTYQLCGLFIHGASLAVTLNYETCKRKGVLATIQDIPFREEIRDKIIADLDNADHLLRLLFISAVNTPVQGTLALIVKICRTLIELWAGNIDKASELATEMISYSKQNHLSEILQQQEVLSVLMPNLAACGNMYRVVDFVSQFCMQSNFIEIDESNLCSGGPIFPDMSVDDFLDQI